MTWSLAEVGKIVGTYVTLVFLGIFLAGNAFLIEDECTVLTIHV